ncbi:MAG: hypothetical protein ACMXYG_03830, partial [Candidatus Woesearchaeota archaeon]
MKKFFLFFLFFIVLSLLFSVSTHAIRTGVYYVTDSSLCPNSCNGQLSVSVHKACGVDGCAYCGRHSVCCTNAAGRYCGEQLCGNGCRDATWGSWGPHPSTVCEGQVFTQTRSCTGGRRCQTPARGWCGSETCSGPSTQQAVGTKYCCVLGPWVWTDNYRCNGNTVQRQQSRTPSCGQASTQWLNVQPCAENQVCVQYDTVNAGCNYKPLPPVIRIDPNPATVIQDLDCLIVVPSTDPDNNYPIMYNYDYFKNLPFNSIYSNSGYINNLNFILQSVHTEDNDNWKCRVAPRDSWNVVGNYAEAYAFILPQINGVCGEAAGKFYYSTAGPLYDLCSEGTPVNPEWKNNRWEWECKGINAGSDSGLCIANAKWDAKCGTGDGSNLNPASRPISFFCESGYVDGSYDPNTWSWECLSNTGGLNASCASNKTTENTVSIECEANQANINSVFAYFNIGASQVSCTPGSWSGNWQRFTCNIPGTGQYEICCSVDETRSWRLVGDVDECLFIDICECVDDEINKSSIPWRQCNGCEWVDLEEICYDRGDEEGNTRCDYDTQTCTDTKGDETCPVGVTGISRYMTATNPCPNEIIDIFCDSSVSGINSIEASIDGTSCNYIGWDGKTAQFRCQLPASPGNYVAKCEINTSKSFVVPGQQFREMSIEIGGDYCCGQYGNKLLCENEGCTWCESCLDAYPPSGTYSGYESAQCIRPELGCFGACFPGKCGAECDGTSIGCNTSTCLCEPGYSLKDEKCYPIIIRTTGFTEVTANEDGDIIYISPLGNFADDHVSKATNKTFDQLRSGVVDNIVIINNYEDRNLLDYYLSSSSNCSDSKTHILNGSIKHVCSYSSSLSFNSIQCTVFADEYFQSFETEISVFGCVKLDDGLWYTSYQEVFTVDEPQLCEIGERLCENNECQEDCEVICPVGPDPLNICVGYSANVTDTDGNVCKIIDGLADCTIPCPDGPDPNEICLGESARVYNALGLICDVIQGTKNCDDIVIPNYLCPNGPNPYEICTGEFVHVYDNLGNICKTISGVRYCGTVDCPDGPDPSTICLGEYYYRYNEYNEVCGVVSGSQECGSVPITICPSSNYPSNLNINSDRCTSGSFDV